MFLPHGGTPRRLPSKQFLSGSSLGWWTLPKECSPRSGLERGAGTERVSMAIANINASPEAQASRRRFTRTGASWRRMLVSQPPPLHLGYLWAEHRSVAHNTELSAAFVKPAPEIGQGGVGLRMGQLYGMVQHRPAHHIGNSVWFRVTWYRPRKPNILDRCYEVCESLLHQTSVVAEFYHMSHEIYPPDPVIPKKFDEEFRCDEFQPYNVVADPWCPSITRFIEWGSKDAVYERSWYPEWECIDKALSKA